MPSRPYDGPPPYPERVARANYLVDGDPDWIRPFGLTACGYGGCSGEPADHHICHCCGCCHACHPVMRA